MSTKSFCLLISVLTPLVGATAEPVPEPLQKAFEMRNAMKTAYLKYRMGSTNGFNGKTMIRNFESRICGNSYLVINHGDDDGVMWMDMQGNYQLGTPNICSPVTDLFDSEKK